MFTQLKTSKNANTGVLSVFFMAQVGKSSPGKRRNHPQGSMGNYMPRSQKQNLEPNSQHRVPLSRLPASPSAGQHRETKAHSQETVHHFPGAEAISVHHFPGAKAISAHVHQTPPEGGRRAGWLSRHPGLKGHEPSQRHDRRCRQSTQESLQRYHA